MSARQPVTLEQLEREHDLLTGRRGTVADLEALDAIARTLVELQAGAVIGIYPSRNIESSRRASTVSGALLRVSEDSAFVPSEQLIGFLCIKTIARGMRSPRQSWISSRRLRRSLASPSKTRSSTSG